MAEIRKYFVKMNMRFNLDSMRTHMLNIRDEMRDDEYDTIEIMGKTMNEDDVENFIDELEDLMSKANYKVTGNEYGRIKAIADARNMMRYATCMANGMSEKEAALAFFD